MRACVGELLFPRQCPRRRVLESCSFLGSVYARAFLTVAVLLLVCPPKCAWQCQRAGTVCLDLLLYSLGRVMSVSKLAQCLCVRA